MSISKICFVLLLLCISSLVSVSSFTVPPRVVQTKYLSSTGTPSISSYKYDELYTGSNRNPFGVSQVIQVTQGSSPEASNEPTGLSVKIEPAYFALWIALLIFAFGFAPGELASQADNDLINKLISDPVSGGDVNRLWFAVWNFFAVVPATLACLLMPSVKKNQWLPPGPFVLGSAFVGYFALGPYMFLKESTNVQPDKSDKPRLGFITKNILENRLFGIGLSALACSVPFVSGLADALSTDAASVLSGYAELFSSSKFVSVATADIFILTILASALIPNDLKLRRGEEGKYDKAIAALTLLAPAIGSALYIALRPPLKEE